MAEQANMTETVDLRKYLGIVLQHRFLALAVFLLVTAGVTAAGMLMKDVYEAKSLVLIEKSEVLAPLLRGMALDSRAETLIRTIKKNLLSRNLLEQVIQKLDLDAELRNKAQYEALITALQEKVNVRVQGTDLFEVSYRGRDPVVVRDIVNTIVSTFIETNVGTSRGETHKAIEFIQQQIDFYKEKLDETDRNLRRFKEENPGILSVNEGALLQKIERERESLAQAELALKEQVREKQSIEQQLKGEEPLSVTLLRRGGGAESRLSEARAELKALLSRYTEQHPSVIRLRREIRELEAGMERVDSRGGEGFDEREVGVNPIYQQLKGRLAETETNIELTTTKIEELKRIIRRDEERLFNIPKEQEELTRLTRGRDVYQNMYDSLMAKLESARVSKALEEADRGESFRVMDPAVLPAKPVKPNRFLILLAGLVLGAGAGIGAPIGLEMLNPTVRDAKDLENLLGVKVLGVALQMRVGEAYLKEKRYWRLSLGFSVVLVAGVLVLVVRAFLLQNMGIRILF